MMQSLKSCHDMVRVADALANVRTTTSIPPLTALTGMRSIARRTFRAFAFFQKELLGIGVWLNILRLAEWVAHIVTVDRVAGLRAERREFYDLIGAIDAAIAVASFQERWPEHCRPEMCDERRIEIQAGCHPLLKGRTANSVTPIDRSALISGSNVSGKTTYITMVRGT